MEDLKPILDRVRELGADHINLQADVRPYRIDDCAPNIEGWGRIAVEAGVPVHIETHRDRMTTDMHFTLHLLDRYPELRLTGDVSHYLVGREFACPVEEEHHILMRRILDNCWGLHGRVASRAQFQVQIYFPQHQDWVLLFMEWWDYGFRSWRRRAPKDATLTFLCELGPPPYAITGADGHELSDRWLEALKMKDMIRAPWRRIQEEDASAASRGEPTEAVARS